MLGHKAGKWCRALNTQGRHCHQKTAFHVHLVIENVQKEVIDFLVYFDPERLKFLQVGFKRHLGPSSF
jgi:hypothetical protein